MIQTEGSLVVVTSDSNPLGTNRAGITPPQIPRIMKPTLMEARIV